MCKVSEIWSRRDQRGDRACLNLTYDTLSANTSVAGETIPPLSNWTDPAKDVKAAIVWLKANSGAYIDPKQVAIFGHSAGGYFYSMLLALFLTDQFQRPGV